MELEGAVFKYGDNVNTDVIIPARYLTLTEPKELASHCMEDLDPDFHLKVKGGDILVAGENFGCGSSREHAPLAIKASGIACVIASSFARIFYRNALNIGLPILECPEASRGLERGDRVGVNLGEGLIKNLSRGTEYRTAPLPAFMQDIMAAGGLMGYITGRRKG